MTDDDRLRQGRLILAHRLAQQGAWWQRLGRMKLDNEDTDGHACIEAGRQMIALSAVVRSRAYARYIDQSLLDLVARKPSQMVFKMITVRLPGSKLPGYAER